MMLGIVVALPWELRTLTRNEIAVGECQAVGPSTLVAVSGIGSERAQAAAAALIAQGATSLISWGYATGLDLRIRMGSLFLPDRIIAGADLYQVEAEWHCRLYEKLAKKMQVHTGALLGVQVVIASTAEKRALGIRSRAIAADMESAGIARLAGKLKRPFAVVRAVVDTASTPLPRSVSKAITSQGSFAVSKLMSGLLFNPGDLTRAARLAFQLNAAQRTLAAAKDLILDL